MGILVLQRKLPRAKTRIRIILEGVRQVGRRYDRALLLLFLVFLLLTLLCDFNFIYLVIVALTLPYS